jgi:hypothetical protein
MTIGGRVKNRSRVVKLSLALLALAVLTSCTPVQPTPVPQPNGGTNVNVVVNVGNGTTPSPAPGGAGSAKPKLVKVTQFGETCPTGTSPSGQDRAVRIGCSKALTCTPKCEQTDGTLLDCNVGSQTPDEFRAFSGAEHISFTASSSNPAFNRDARGISSGLVLIDCTFAGVRSEPFDLTVVP